MLHEELTEKILEACFEVSNELGVGFVESVYQKATMIAVRDKNLHVEAEVPLNVDFRDKNVGQFFADLLVEKKVILELKAVRELAPEHEAQIINYLHATGMDVGLLLNFGKSRLQFRRFDRRKRTD